MLQEHRCALQDDDGRGLTEEEIQAEANTFMFAGDKNGDHSTKKKTFVIEIFFLTGHDTTASAICWTLYNLARHTHCQEKCRQEVLDLMQGRDEHGILWLAHEANWPFNPKCLRSVSGHSSSLCHV